MKKEITRHYEPHPYRVEEMGAANTYTWEVGSMGVKYIRLNGTSVIVTLAQSMIEIPRDRVVLTFRRLATMIMLMLVATVAGATDPAYLILPNGKFAYAQCVEDGVSPARTDMAKCVDSYKSQGVPAARLYAPQARPEPARPADPPPAPSWGRTQPQVTRIVILPATPAPAPFVMPAPQPGYRPDPVALELQRQRSLDFLQNPPLLESTPWP